MWIGPRDDAECDNSQRVPDENFKRAWKHHPELFATLKLLDKNPYNERW